MVLPSSTVITPSLPTFFMASAMMRPMVLSLLAEMVPTWAMASCRRYGLLYCPARPECVAFVVRGAERR